MMKGKQSLRLFIALIAIIVSVKSYASSAIGADKYVTVQAGKESYLLFNDKKVSVINISANDFVGVKIAAKNLQDDFFLVSGKKPVLDSTSGKLPKETIIIGTLGKSELIDKMVKAGKIDISGIKGKWEAYQLQVVNNPLPGVSKALVIVGSDKRGTIFGIYDLSAQIGVSPLNWWADVPAKKSAVLYANLSKLKIDMPAVQYRGIFINDEAPALSGWVYKNFGGFNHKFYEKVFELILRMRGNYLWPAMWGNSFSDDDKLSPKVADDYGVVIGTSHHEPMMRAHAEWQRYHKGQKWSYQVNDSILRQFWKEGIQRMENYESIVTVGMRGDGDEPMSEENNIALLEKIVADQRNIIQEVTKKNPAEIPQIWALYKEVQDYYDKGMRVPDDVTLLLCDDNWGNVRKLPLFGDKKHPGGYGMYYHFDYVGGPRNYKWLNTNQIERTWEQMHLCYEYGVKKLWLVNVGDIKPMEFPIEFFLDYGWAPEKWNAENIQSYYKLWAKENFGETYANEVSWIMALSSKYSARRKPELIDPATYSLVNYNEADNIVDDYNRLLEGAKNIGDKLSAEYKDAYYQLVLHPIEACVNQSNLYVTVAKNRLYAKQGRASTNVYAAKARQLFNNDTAITHYYNKILTKGKWDHFMDQTHIGYTYWQQPDSNSMPAVIKIQVSDTSLFGVSVQGSEIAWPNDTVKAELPQIDPYNDTLCYFEVFAKGLKPSKFEVLADSFVYVSTLKGSVADKNTIKVSVDWGKVKAGKSTSVIMVKDEAGKVIAIELPVYKLEMKESSGYKGFITSSGYASFEAQQFTNKVETDGMKWAVIPNLGKTMSGVTTMPVYVASVTPSGESPRLEYSVYFTDTGKVEVNWMFSPTLDFNDNKGLNFAVSIDDETPQIINMHADKSMKEWERRVANNVTRIVSKHKITTTGKHVIKYWMVDPGVVLQKVMVDCGGLKPSYLGAPATAKY